MTGLTHIDENGKAVMVDVTAKEETVREARACGKIKMSPAAYEAAVKGEMKKGDVFGAARIAGIMAAKKTSDMIPLCHPLQLSRIAVDFSFDDENCTVSCESTVGLCGKTGVEMEALTAVSMALLTVYDMCKAIDKSMVIGEIRLHEKSGGKSGHYISEND